MKKILVALVACVAFAPAAMADCTVVNKLVAASAELVPFSSIAPYSDERRGASLAARYVPAPMTGCTFKDQDLPKELADTKLVCTFIENEGKPVTGVSRNAMVATQQTKVEGLVNCLKAYESKPGWSVKESPGMTQTTVTGTGPEVDPDGWHVRPEFKFSAGVTEVTEHKDESGRNLGRMVMDLTFDAPTWKKSDLPR